MCLHTMQAEADSLVARRPCFLLGSVDQVLACRVSHEFTVSGTDDAALLRARLLVRRAVRLVGIGGARGQPPFPSLRGRIGMKLRCSLAFGILRVNVTGLTMTEAVMEALSALPDWGVELTLSVNAWALPDAAYEELARQVPVSYTTWRLIGDVPAGVLNSICDGINARRAGMSLPQVLLVVSGGPAWEERGDNVVLCYTQGGWIVNVPPYQAQDSDSD